MNLLIIDDNDVYLKMATRVLEGYHEVVTASSYEEAIEKMQKVDGVITDLFFPSQINWFEEVKKMQPSGYETVYKESIQKSIKKGVAENPSGLGIALLCKERAIAFIIVSDGSRHHGDLGTVRDALLATGFVTQKWDPLPELLYGMNGANKMDPMTWQGAAANLKKF